MTSNKIDLSPYNPKNNFSIPNIISLFRLALIPFIFLAYSQDHPGWAVTLVVISGVSDGVDGIIARRCNQITELGKLLDPLADKLTQIALTIILCSTFTAIIPLVVVLLAKELLMLLLGLRMMKKGGRIIAAKWWGKVSTTAFYVGMVVIMLFAKQLGGGGVTAISIIISLLMLFSLIQYWREFQRRSAELNP